MNRTFCACQATRSTVLVPLADRTTVYPSASRACWAKVRAAVNGAFPLVPGPIRSSSRLPGGPEGPVPVPDIAPPGS